MLETLKVSVAVKREGSDREVQSLIPVRVNFFNWKCMIGGCYNNNNNNTKLGAEAWFLIDKSDLK